MPGPDPALDAPAGRTGPRTYWLETLGCPKNEVDSDKLDGVLRADGLVAAEDPQSADLIVVNTCAFVEAAREESVNTILDLDDLRKDGSRLVATGCMAERYGEELSRSIVELDAVAGFGRRLIPVSAEPLPDLDLLNLPRPPARSPWAYVKVAEGCDRNCGFCAIPSFRGRQRSRSVDSILAEVEGLGVREVVLVAQDLASFGRDQGVGERAIVPLVKAVAEQVEWVRLLYLYPSELTDELVEVVCGSAVPYFDLSLQHVSRPLLRRMRRWGDGRRFARRLEQIRAREPAAAFRSNFIVGYPGETEADHDALLRFVEESRLDWCGFFAFSPEEGTFADTLDDRVDAGLVADRLAELGEMQDAITASRRDELIGRRVRALVDRPGQARTFREAPEIDGVVEVPLDLEPGTFHDLVVDGATGPDLRAAPVVGVATMVS